MACVICSHTGASSKWGARIRHLHITADQNAVSRNDSAISHASSEIRQKEATFSRYLSGGFTHSPLDVWPAPERQVQEAIADRQPLANRRKRALSREKIATHCTTTVSPYPRPHRFYLPKGLEQAQTKNKASSVRTREQSFFCVRLRLGRGGRHVCWPPVRTRSLRRPSSLRNPQTITPDLTFWLISQSWISTLIIK